MDPIQVTIIVISFVLTLLIIFLSVQVWYILKEFRGSMQKVNKMLDDAGKVSGTVSDGVVGMGGLVQGFKTGLEFFTSMKKKGEDRG